MAAEVKEQMEGKWIVYKSEDFGSYLDKLGVGAVKKKFATSMNPKLKMTFDGDVITAKIKAGPKTNKASFKLGEEYDVETEFGASKVLLRIVKSAQTGPTRFRTVLDIPNKIYHNLWVPLHGLQSLPPSPKRAERKGRRRPFREAGSGHKQWNTAISTWEDGRLKTIIKPIDSSKKEQLVVREIVDGEMIQYMTVDGVTAKRFFKKCVK